MVQERVIEKVRKMLAIANDRGASEGERDNAMRMAHSYLVKFNLSMDSIENTDRDRVKEEDTLRQANDWSRACMNAISDLFFCKFFFMHDKINQVDRNFFIGKKSNAMTAKELSLFVVRSINKEANKTRKSLKADSKFSRSFCEGATMKIIERCLKLKEEAIKADSKDNSTTSTGTNLVLASFYEQELEQNLKFISDNMKLNLKSTPLKQKATDNTAYARGMMFGEQINLNKQID